MEIQTVCAQWRSNLHLFLWGINIAAVMGSSSEVWCGQRPLVDPPNGLRIVGGRIAPLGAWPWQVSIQRGHQHFCAGTILNQMWVVSAAHCFKRDGSTSNLQVLAGQQGLYKRVQSTQYRGVNQVIVHDDYDKPEFDNDIAILQLSKPLQYTDYVQPICTIPNKTVEDALSFSPCFVSGWGATRYEGPSSSRLQEAEVDIIPRQTCNQIGWYQGLITNNMICAGYEEGQIDACQGDSGGPLQCYSEEQDKFFLLGVVSFGDKCATPKKPGVYTRASKYSTWLQEIAASSSLVGYSILLHTACVMLTLWTLV